MQFVPFTKNIIFYDAEFSSFDPYVGELLSVGFVKMSGEELYLEVEHSGECSDWITENLLPALTAPKVSRSEAVVRITEFVGESKPYLLSYINDFDVVYLRKLLRNGQTSFDFAPFHWLPLDMASIFVGLGLSPEDYMKDEYQYIKNLLGIETKSSHTHNALDDARLLRKVYLRLIDSPEFA